MLSRWSVGTGIAKSHGPHRPQIWHQGRCRTVGLVCPTLDAPRRSVTELCCPMVADMIRTVFAQGNAKAASEQ